MKKSGFAQVMFFILLFLVVLSGYNYIQTGSITGMLVGANESNCTDDGDCDPGYFCNESNFCEGIEGWCDVNDDCEFDFEECSSNECVNLTCSNGTYIYEHECVECLENGDCSVGEECNGDHECEQIDGWCDNETACPAGQECNLNLSECEVIEGWCGENSVCLDEEFCNLTINECNNLSCSDEIYDHECVECLEDDDCGSGEECNGDHECEDVSDDDDGGGDDDDLDCSGSKPYEKSGKCVECTKNDHCKSSEKCANGDKCETVICGSGYKVSDHVCVKIEVAKTPAPLTGAVVDTDESEVDESGGSGSDGSGVITGLSDDASKKEEGEKTIVGESVDFVKNYVSVVINFVFGDDACSEGKCLDNAFLVVKSYFVYKNYLFGGLGVLVLGVGSFMVHRKRKYLIEKVQSLRAKSDLKKGKKKKVSAKKSGLSKDDKAKDLEKEKLALSKKEKKQFHRDNRRRKIKDFHKMIMTRLKMHPTRKHAHHHRTSKKDLVEKK